MTPSETGPQKCLSIHDISNHTDEPVQSGRFYKLKVEHKMEGIRTFTVTPRSDGLLKTTSDGKLLSRRDYGVFEVETL